MKLETISAIRDFTLKVRVLLEKEASEQLEGIYGFLPSGTLEPSRNYPALRELPEVQKTRSLIGQLLEDEKGAGMSPKDARQKLVKGTAFTWLNRFVAFKMMETRGLIRQAISKGQKSNGFLLWLTEPGNEKILEKYDKGDLPQNALGEGPRQEAYRQFILTLCGQLAQEIKVLFDPEDLFSQFIPRPPVLARLFEGMNGPELEEAWKAGNEETIGWVYQYFIKEDKEKVFDKIYTQKKKMDLRDIPAATQIFTPKWIVRYLVENTLGRLWLRMHPDSRLMEKMKYYVPNDNDRQSIPFKPAKEITLLDPACGTMHFGTVAFDLFYEMYLEEMAHIGEEGWPKEPSVKDTAEIPASIIADNLYGIDLDLRAVQLSSLTLFIKAKSFNGKVTLKKINLTYTDIPEFSASTINAFVDSLETAHAVTKKLLRQILPILNKAYYLGSLLKIETVVQEFIQKEQVALKDFQHRQPGLPGFESRKQLELDLILKKKIVWEEVKAEILWAFQQFIKTHKEAQGAFVANETMKGLGLIDALVKKHDVVVCNPPYSGRRNMNELLRNDLKGLYPKKDGDLYTVFIDRCLDLTSDHYGFLGMVTVHSFMFTSSHEDIRREIINNTEIETMAHLGTRTFGDLSNPNAQGFSMYVLGKSLNQDIDKSLGIYFRLVKENDNEEKCLAFCDALQDYLTNRNTFSAPHLFILEQEKLKAIPGWPMVYWVSDGLRDLFKGKFTGDVAKTCQGIATANNFRFLRYWWECGRSLISFDTTTHEEASKFGFKWFPYMKGGEVKRWYGNQEQIVNWRKSGAEIKNYFKDGRLASRPQNQEYYFKEGATYSFLTVSNLSVRYLPKGFIFDVIGSSIFTKNIGLNLLLGILNSKLSTFIIKLINPTVAYQVGDLARIPVPDILNDELVSSIEENVKSCINLKKNEVSFQEVGWEFISPMSWGTGLDDLLRIEKELAIQETDISQGVYKLYKVPQAEIKQIESEFGALPGNLPKIDNPSDPALRIINTLYLEKHVPDEVIHKTNQVIEEDTDEGEGEEESTKGRGRQKRFLTLEELCLASGFHPETVYSYIVAHKLERPEERYELAVAWVSYAMGILLGRFKPGQKGELGSALDENGRLLLDIDIEKIRKLVDEDGIMVLDSGHSNELPARVDETLAILLGETEAKQVMSTLGGDLLKFLEKEFFIRWHIPQYRKRPVYWLIQSPGKTYGLYLFHERLHQDTLFRIRTVYVEPKINHLEAQIANLKIKRDQVEGREKRNLDKEISRLVDVLDDVREFLKLLEKLVEERGYIPHIDDGVLLNMAPLWELIPFWQAEPKKAWQALERGDYDWAGQAMDHWPDRVKEKCLTNQSFAIAHGLA